MAVTQSMAELLQELEAIRQDEDPVIAALLQKLEEAERRGRVVQPEDLSGLSGALASLEATIGELQARLARAETGAATPAPSATNGTTTPTVEALASSVRANDAEATRLLALVRERFVALVPAVDAGEPSHAASPSAILPRTFRLTSPRMIGNDVKAFQRVLNRRFQTWGSDEHTSEDGEYGPETRKAARAVAQRLGIAAADYEHGFTSALRGLIRTPSGRTPEQLERARKLRKPAHGAARARPSSSGTAPAAPSGLAAAIRAGGGRYEDAIIREAKRSGLSVSLVCAVIQHETGFQNVFGHDGVANPIKSPPGGLLTVTKERYQQYLRQRRLGQGCQGVGPAQLTSSGLQDQADRLGGCHEPGPNIRVGCAYLAEEIKARGLVKGVQAYNGAPGDHYAKAVLDLEHTWRTRLEGAHVASPGKPSGPTGTPRTFRLGMAPRTGDDVKAFQRVLNHRFRMWGVDRHTAEDGEYGPETRRAALQVAHGLGIAPAGYAHGITPALRGVIRSPSRRTPRQLELARQNRAWLGKLRKQHASVERGRGALRERAYTEARRLLDMGVMEVGGNNQGKMVLTIIRGNGGTGPEAWCGDFVAFCYRKAGSKSVTRAWAGVRQYLPLTGLKGTKTPLKGDLVRYTFDHIGMFVSWCDSAGKPATQAAATHIRTIEGNTGRSGAVSDSRTGGDGIYMKLRSRTLVKDFIHVLR
jgi:peptidoglycan hydrolase-like protein with peptidoglycan-binding domain